MTKKQICSICKRRLIDEFRQELELLTREELIKVIMSFHIERNYK